jgi:uncharacterized membrane protein YraQ (UPF0718 family)
MLIPTLFFAVLAAVLLYYGYSRGEGEHLVGLRWAWRTLVSIFPLLIAAFIVAGMTQALLPKEAIVKWVGAESGVRGIFIGALGGALTPGGPFVSFPLAVGFWNAGAGVGPVVAYLTGWAVWGLSRLPLEVALLGWRLTAIRMASTFFLPPLAGIAARILFRRFAGAP